MKKLFPFALALASLTVVPGAAMALDTSEAWDIAIVTRDRGDVDVGNLRFEPAEALGEDSDADFDEDLGGLDTDMLEACRYFVSWTNNADLPSRTNLVLDEIATVSYADCDENAEENFPTILITSSDVTNRGFNRQQQRRTINAMILGETEDGQLSGVIQFSSGGVYSVAAHQDP